MLEKHKMCPRTSVIFSVRIAAHTARFRYFTRTLPRKLVVGTGCDPYEPRGSGRDTGVLIGLILTNQNVKFVVCSLTLEMYSSSGEIR
jgi:hypothetical protein